MLSIPQINRCAFQIFVGALFPRAAFHHRRVEAGRFVLRNNLKLHKFFDSKDLFIQTYFLFSIRERTEEQCDILHVFH